MSDEHISEDFKALGRNITEVLRAAWNSQERKNLQQEIEEELKDFGTAMNRVVEEIAESDMGQKIKAEVGEIKERVDSGEVESKVRSEVQSALKNINQELENLIGKFNARDES